MDPAMSRRASLAVLALVVASCYASDKFMDDYKQGGDAKSTSSGLVYKVLRAGTGGKPSKSTPCKTHYEGRLTKDYPSGPTFDSSYARGTPTTFAPNQVIKGWTEAMQLMSVGSKWEIVCPPDLAYGSRGAGAKIPPNSVLVFTMELISCQGVASEGVTAQSDFVEGATVQADSTIDPAKAHHVIQAAPTTTTATATAASASAAEPGNDSGGFLTGARTMMLFAGGICVAFLMCAGKGGGGNKGGRRMHPGQG